jgi:hypothetical protein
MFNLPSELDTEDIEDIFDSDITTLGDDAGVEQEQPGMI